MPKKISIIILAILILAIFAVGAWYFFLKPVPDGNPLPIVINPEELIIFEVKNVSLSEYQKEQAFKRFTDAKNIISQNQTAGIGIGDDANYYPWLAIAGAQKSIGDYDRASQIWIWFTDMYAGNSISPANLGDLYKFYLLLHG